MKKTTLIALLIASSLTLSGCAGVSEDAPNGASGENGTVDRTPSETVEPTTNPKLAEYGALTQEEFFALAPESGSDVLRSDLKAIVAASIVAGSEAMYEEIKLEGDPNISFFYKNTNKNEGTLAFVIDKNGVLIPETAIIYDNLSLLLSDISLGFEDGAVKGITQDADGGYLLSIKYPQEDGTDISLMYYVTIKDGLVNAIVHTASYSPDMPVMVRFIKYGVDEDYEKYYEGAAAITLG